MNDKRGRIRAPFKIKITLITSVKKIEIGDSRNISLNGVFVETHEKLPIGSECRVLITLTEIKPSIILSIESEIVRHDPTGMGITFKKMEVDDYEHLRNIVLYNTPETEAFIHQSLERPGFK